MSYEEDPWHWMHVSDFEEPTMTKKPGEIVRRDDLLRAAEVERDALAVDLRATTGPTRARIIRPEDR